MVHPFAETIERQYNRREELFDNPDTLPAFASLRTVKAVQSIGNEANGFGTWFDALEWMEKELDKEPYDVALIGCGAYGFPLAAYAKRTGHKAVHPVGHCNCCSASRASDGSVPTATSMPTTTICCVPHG